MTTTTTMAHLTLEEFMNSSSSAPLPTILLPRPQAARLVELCELAEMTPSAGFLDFVAGNDNGSSAAAAAGAHPHALVTQMALLLYLGEYGHARHLWRRHRGTPSPSAASDRAQLEMMWGAAKYVYLWSTGGVHSLSSSSSGAGPAAVEDDAGMMQVEDGNDNEGGGSAAVSSSSEEGSLPFGALALRALQSCSSSDAQPLSNYSAELLGVFRSRINRQLHESFDKLERDEFRLRMNLEGGEGSGNDEVWGPYGWMEEGGYLVSNNVEMLGAEVGALAEELEMGTKEDRIGKLTDYVMFLEGKVNA